jgi:hypothetical protein
MTVFVLWEDKAISPIASFGPHMFLVACVASRLGIDRYRLTKSEAIGGKPCGGNANLLRELQHGPLWDGVMYVVAVLDTDKIHDRIHGIPSRRMITATGYQPWSDSVVRELRNHAPEAVQRQLKICFLDHNLETLLSLVGNGMPELDTALGKNLLARDKILHRAAADEGQIGKACASMPSWEHLVATVTRLVAGGTLIAADPS